MQSADMPADQAPLAPNAHDDQFHPLDRRAASGSVRHLASPEREATCFRALEFFWPLAPFYPGGDVRCAWC